MKKYTPDEVRMALDYCSKQSNGSGDDPSYDLCDKCPFSKGTIVCDDVIIWNALPPHFSHPSNLKRKDLRDLHKEACKQLCDPLYMDLLIVKGKGGRKCQQ
jgi:hypothetical protein